MLLWILSSILLLIPPGFTKELSDTAKPNKTCKPVPNTIRPSYNKPEISQFIIGHTWYPYLLYDSKNDTNPFFLNAEIHYESLGRGNEPTRNSPADIVIQEETYFDVNGTCSDLLEISWLTNDGRQIGPVFDVTSNNTLSVNSFDDSVLWKTDLKTFIMFHNCDTRNSVTGNCDRVFIYVHTTSKPHMLTDATKQTVTTAVEKVLQPYCLGLTHFSVYKWDDNLEVCPPSDPENHPDAFKIFVDNYKLLAEKPA
ncbi:uncharacterized protein LOC129595606 [Paramacrobiotus metropolitanus]|uniref:uncharacterized protein LOC129595606 n=1 Tax=Paramacrobiotus metropolitanus TaxID=2943436 RepID=UPI00244602E4|nr:uncharacterized protein LOC129595606 [Paramacrobiotus metropolitanus]XP_055348638.1 uncharacterized protein LOC129595606 [Paramacrobiotus metropolitanus]XP_055348639.1 uncharacterized protein LOC129595606 [Paramacrobiotus metropolitanus]XP_055348640.1 uncharacterized protein LOC129595606 [Paramacrobiotus metropolitanus]